MFPRFKLIDSDNSTSNVDADKCYTVFTWNIEGFGRNVFNLVDLLKYWKPDFVMLSEPQIFMCDIEHSMSYLRGQYEFSLNSYDVYDPELPLFKVRAYGGTLIL